MKPTRWLLLIPVLLAWNLGLPADITSGDALLRAMYERYKSSWYDTITFTQKSTTYNPDGTTKVETWYEAALLPGRLRIDVAPLSDGNGVILDHGNAAFFRDGKQVGTRPLINILLVLGFDVYRQEPATTINLVKGEGYDLSKIREDSWEGHPAFVVGADKGDLKSKQFWIDKDSLLFVRVIEPSQGDPAKQDDIRFAGYRKLPTGWVAARVEVYTEGKKVFSEDYSDIQSNVKLDPAVFDPRQFATTHWEKQ